jgi:hypothetical protein
VRRESENDVDDDADDEDDDDDDEEEEGDVDDDSVRADDEWNAPLRWRERAAVSRKRTTPATLRDKSPSARRRRTTQKARVPVSKAATVVVTAAQPSKAASPLIAGAHAIAPWHQCFTAQSSSHARAAQIAAATARSRTCSAAAAAAAVVRVKVLTCVRCGISHLCTIAGRMRTLSQSSQRLNA